MLRTVLILTDDGQIVVDQTYSGIPSFEREFIRRFLLAIIQFGQETFNAPVQEILFSKLKILLQPGNGYCIAGISDLEDDTTQLKLILRRISDEFCPFQKDTFSR